MTSLRHASTVALVTGAASGIGRATAMLLADEGAKVVATDVGAEGLASLAAERPGVLIVHGDLTDAGFVTDLVARAESIGPIGLVANVAGIMDHFVPAGEVGDDLWDAVMAVNLTAPMRLCRAVLPAMCTRGSGAIVNVSSAAGLGGSGAGAAYHTSKHGLIGLSKHVAFTYGPRGVRCNVVCPGAVVTNIGTTAAPAVQWAYERQLEGIALAGPPAQPEQIASAISWLGSKEADNVNGTVLPVDGGWKSA